ncbi:hypothetical protein DYB31_011308 [Aphanomyces astaci]|uniref:Uncharacterized protein n=1 Tax=Aphanomyces astaci TaxID=112090 RepID=A0A397F6Z9_APHAT|nr:hypothetical protein DYB31_011308 [Aphanomyces astaci]
MPSGRISWKKNSAWFTRPSNMSTWVLYSRESACSSFDGRVNHAEFSFQQILPLDMLLCSLITFKFADRLGRATMLELAAIPYVLGFCMQFVPDTPSYLLLRHNDPIMSFSVCLKIQNPASVNRSTRAEVRVNSIFAL